MKTATMLVVSCLCASILLLSEQSLFVAAQQQGQVDVSCDGNVAEALCEPGSHGCDNNASERNDLKSVVGKNGTSTEAKTAVVDVAEDDKVETEFETDDDVDDDDDKASLKIERLDEKPDVQEEILSCDDYRQLWKEDSDWYSAGKSKSLKQDINIFHNPISDDACLVLGQGSGGHWLHACASNRPHYHEVFVHYPARFLDKVQRVLFIGGGDSMVLHEVLKYKDLEKVVGLELDQEVVRSVYKHFATQPHFDDDRVEWYFGDAAAALRALPREYYGTFDLVVLDILTYIAEMLKVTEEYSVMEAAMLLLKPDGIIIKNEDEGYQPGSSVNFAKNIVDVMYYDVPVYCLQNFVMGSNGVNFLEKEPVDHGVSTLYLKDMDEFRTQFDTWYTVSMESNYNNNNNNNKGEEKPPTSTSFRPLGLTLILEAEKVALPLESSESIQSLIGNVLKGHSLTQISMEPQVTYLTPSNEDLDGGYSISFLFKEGTLVTRCFPKVHYCAFDIQLWSAFFQLDAIRSDLVAILKSERSSVFRIVSSGVTVSNDMSGPPPRVVTDEVPTAQDSEEPDFFYSEMDDEIVQWRNATLYSYDNSDALQQWKFQQAIGVQTFLQFQYSNTSSVDEEKISPEALAKILKKVLKAKLVSTDIQLVSVELVEGQGDQVFIANWGTGNMVAFWDGISQMDVNLLEIKATTGTSKDILATGKIFERKFQGWEVVARDVFPRGWNRVMNFESEYGVRTEYLPYWSAKEEVEYSSR